MTLIAGIVAVALIYAALNVVKGADPKFLARLIKIGGRSGDAGVCRIHRCAR